MLHTSCAKSLALQSLYQKEEEGLTDRIKRLFQCICSAGTYSRPMACQAGLFRYHSHRGCGYTYILPHQCSSHASDKLHRLPTLTSEVVEADCSGVRLLSLHWVMTLCVSLSTPVSLSERLVSPCFSLLLDSHHTSYSPECSHFV